MTQQPVWFGKYLLIDKIAQGGMAEIFLAKLYGAEGFEKEVVIKKILPQWSANQEFLTMLIDEAKLAVLLNHANIVQIYELGKEGNDYYIAMEYVHGIDLRKLSDQARQTGRRIPTEIALLILTEALEGLAYAHGKKNNRGEALKIIHRDISPQNILVSFDGAVKLTDFGIAKAAMRSTETVSGVHKGKFSYMSPEQANLDEISQASDLFSMGIVLFETLTGRRLFGGNSDIETLDRIRKSAVAFEPQDEIPSELKEIILKALSRNPEGRSPTAAAFREALTQFAARQNLLAGHAQLAQYLEHLFGKEIQQDRRRIDTIQKIERTLSVAVPRDTARVFVARSSRLQQLANWRKKIIPYRQKILVGAVLLLLVSGSLLWWLSARVASPPTAGTNQPTSVAAGAKTSPSEATPGTFLSVMVAPWGYVSIDRQGRRESPVMRLKIAPGTHQIAVTHGPKNLTASTRAEIRSGAHVRCVAHFDREPHRVQCR